LHDHNVILTVVTEEIPRRSDEGRVTAEKLSERFSRVTVRFGFMESSNLPKALRAAGFDLDNASFFLSRRALQPSAQAGLPLWQDYIFIPMARSASDVSDQFCIPEDQAVEVGARITI
jgi:KUP system potassium uptake protein